MAVRKAVKQRRNVSVAEDAALGVMKAADYLQQALAEVCERHGITTDQYGMLRILRDAHPTGFARGEVAERCIHRAPDVTRMLDRLVGRRLARRTRAPADRRCSVATITKAGLALLARMDDEVTAAIRDLTKPLSLPELEHLTRLTGALTR